jgi:hypothetical protein
VAVSDPFGGWRCDVLGEEQGSTVEGLVGFVEDTRVGLEDVRHIGGHVEDDVHAGIASASVLALLRSALERDGLGTPTG